MVFATLPAFSFRSFFASLVLLTVFALTACGGGGGGGTQQVESGTGGGSTGGGGNDGGGSDDDGSGGDGGSDDGDTPIIPNTGKPAFGLYALDGAAGTFRDGAIRDYDFVDGYAWRFGWDDIEVAEGDYDFSGLEHIVAELSAINKKLSWLLFPGTPTYLNSHPDIDTWNDGGETKPLPWDPDFIARHQAFIRAVANHEIPDPQAGGELVPFKDHSVVAILHPNFPGLPRAALRNGDVTDVASVPGYSRENLATLIESVMTVWAEEYPEKPLLISLWNIQDSDRDSALWEFAQDELAKYGNVGLFQDNLQASRATPSSSAVDSVGPNPDGLGLALKHETLWTGFQMLGSWANPNPNHQDNLINGTIFDGLEFGFGEYNSFYYEVYTADLDNPDWQAELRFWQEQLTVE